jgi:FAD/FMN-containing dehydrogenase
MTTSTTDGPERLADELRRTTGPERVLTSGPDYERSCAIWNGAVHHRPAVVLRGAPPQDVQAGVRAARRFEVPLSVRAGGHGWTGRALTDGGLTLDLSPMRQVTVDPAGAVADVAGGAVAADLAGAAEPHGLAAVTGTVGAVGVAGLALGGGYGPLTGRYGLAVDSILSADVVLADGSLVAADNAREPDLFWALRGGGGNFGVVTSLRIRLHAARILAGMIMFPVAQATTVLASLADILLDGPDELTVQCGFVAGPDGQPVLFVAPAWCGDPDEGTRAMEGLTGLGTPLLARTGPVTAAALLAQSDGLFPDGRAIEIRPRTLAALTPTAIEALVARGRALTSPWSAISVHSLHGAAARVPMADTAFGLRAPHLLVETIAIWEPGDAAEAAHRAWAAGVSDALAGEALPGGYPNLLGPDDPAQIAHAYGSNTQRLLALKDRYDPDRVFTATPLPDAAP